MRQLILLRHAKALADSASGEDFDRPLAARGETDAPVIGDRLAREGADPQVVLVSDARRTRETWSLVAPSFPKAHARFLHALYLSPAELIAAEADKAGADRVMIIGHNPGIHELASRWAHRNGELEARLRAKFPTCAGAIFTRKDENTSWSLQSYITPKTSSD